MLWQEIQRVPWAALVFQLESVGISLLVWQLCKHHYRRAWLRSAPTKARDTILQLRRRLARRKRREKKLLAQLAEARGQLAAVQQGLEKPEATPLLYARGRWRPG